MLAGAVALAAAVPAQAFSATPSPKRGKILFIAACGSCHTLQAAGTHGRTGGNLAEEARPVAEVAARVRQGGAGMPAFGRTLTAGQIVAIARFVATATAAPPPTTDAGRERAVQIVLNCSNGWRQLAQ
jgi:mono/diheme cytochrome c family protein